MSTMISYAQNFEDVILERIFKGKKTGFYIDVGACHPIYDSVTHHFYLKGWSGINLEPQPALFAELVSVRRRDINLNVCAGKQPGRMTLAITTGIGTSTLDPVLAEKYRCADSVVEEIDVELITLDHVWNEHVGERTVDFLKIDVEGFEQNVLLGADFEKIAPSIIVIEATQPNSEELCHEQWEYLLLDHYEFLYFDGLNRFYQRKGFIFEAGFKKTPPNVFDQFTTYPHLLLEQANATLLEDREELNGQLQSAQAQLLFQERALAEAAGAYQALQTVHQVKVDELCLAQELLERLNDDLVAHASNAADQFEKNQAQLQLKEQALAEAVNAYQALQAAYQVKVDELCLAQELLESLNGDLVARASNAADQFEKNQAQLQLKEQALAEAVNAYQSLQMAYQEKVDELRLAQELLERLNGDLVAHASNAADQFEKNQAQLQLKEQALAEAISAYQALQAAYQAKVDELRLAQELLERLNGDLAARACNAADQFEKNQAQLLQKEQALAEAASAYQALQAAYQAKEDELCRARELLQGKDEALLDASHSYQQLVLAYELKEQELQAQILQLSIDLREVKDRSEEIQEGLYAKDLALADAAKANQHLRDAIDEKTRELAELHTRFATQS